MLRTRIRLAGEGPRLLARLLFPALLAFGQTAAAADDLLGLLPVAEQGDARYQSAWHKWQSDQELVNLSRGDLLPTVALTLESKETDQKINESENAVFDSGSDRYPTETYGLTVTQSVFDYARWKRFDQSRASSNLAEVEFQLARQELLLRLAESYFLVLERGDQLAAVEDKKLALELNFETSTERYKSGLARRVEVDESRARFLAAVAEEAELESRLQDSRYRLREILGTAPGELARLRIDAPLDPPVPDDVEQWVDMALNHNLELQVKNLELRVADLDVAALRSGHFPTLDLLLSANNTDTGGSVFGGGSDIDNTEVILQLNVPLYEGGKTSARIRQSLEKRNSVLQDRNHQLRVTERATRDAFGRINSALRQIDALQQSVNAERRLLQTATVEHRSGQGSFSQVLDARQNLSVAIQALTKARYDYVLNLLRLEFETGRLDEEYLGTINGWLAAGVR